MLEVHPPDHGLHSWRDFFVHMATICLGLLIAIGLEQSVEWMHRQHERAELRDAIHRDLEDTFIAYINREAHGLALALLHGERNLKRLEDAESQPMPPSAR